MRPFNPLALLHRRPYLLASLAGVLLLAAATPVVVNQAQQQAVAIVTTGRLNVRSGPSSGFTVLAKLDLGDQLALLGRNPDQSWVQVRTPAGVEGWVSTLYIETLYPLGDLPVTSDIIEYFAQIGNLPVNAREGPGIEYAVLFVVPEYAVMSTVGRTANGNWLLIRSESRLGWVNAAYVLNWYPNSLLPVAWDGGVTPGEPPPTPGGPTGPTGPAPQPPAGSPIATVTTGRLNVREGPSSGFHILGKLNEGDQVTMIGRNPDESWVQISLAGGTGWITTLYIQSSYPLRDLPVTSDIIEYYAQVGNLPVNVREGPGIEYAVKFTLAEYTIISMIGKDNRGWWVFIRYDSQTGWANAQFILNDVPLSYLPILN